MSAPKISETTTEVGLLGRRDAFHVPGVLVKTNSRIQVRPGEMVRFVDANCTIVEPCSGDRAEAIVDPFIDHLLNAPLVGSPVLFWVFLLPGLSGNLTHNFDIVRESRLADITNAEDRGDDGQCAACYGPPDKEDDEEDDEEDDNCKACY